ncbi:T9SS type A sorting domain-containing protein [Sediminitomix flava]|uniref:Putative secreted protein (Por secretion system target) n=1 Tax=Sediminitomix flava TaxID=379075 RepID=A0A315ZGM7_SEDFL|nr:T9SS type A sorting domain-containing protein [Sediminitomix flava]PWJ43894.1 putative secreted protein (Por secretion system target) [Sediminitomix flava]
MRKIHYVLTIILVLTRITYSFGQTESIDLNNSDDRAGVNYDWSDNNTWNPAGTPPDPDTNININDTGLSADPQTATVNDRVQSSHFIKYLGDVTLDGTKTWNIEGVVVIDGNFTQTAAFANNQININGGALIITGSFSQSGAFATSGVNLSNNAMLIVDGDVNIYSTIAGGTFTNDGSNINIIIGGDLDINNDLGNSSISTGDNGNIFVEGETNGNGTVDGQVPDTHNPSTDPPLTDGGVNDAVDDIPNLGDIIGGTNPGGSIDAALPIQLISFSLNQQEKNIKLQWTTASEINSDYFEVLCSFDGSNYESLVSIPAQGNSESLVEYAYEYQYQGSAQRYYRLKQVDLDGKYTLSKVLIFTPKLVKNLSLVKPNVYPNPAKSFVKVQLDGIEIREVMIFSTDGKAFPLEIQRLASGEVKLDVNNIPRGLYIMKLITDTQSYSEKVLLE